MENNLTYVEPYVEVIDCSVERGYCLSSGNNEDPVYNSPIGW